MSLQPVQQEQVQGTAQQMLSFLSDENVNVPGNMLEAIVSGKSLLRGIIGGQLILCQSVNTPPKPLEPEEEIEGVVEPAE